MISTATRHLTECTTNHKVHRQAIIRSFCAGDNFIQEEEGEEAAACAGSCQKAETEGNPKSRELCRHPVAA